MKHAGAAALDALEPLLAELRLVAGLTERKRGVFYRKSSAFVHFHEDPAGRFPDLKRDGAWRRVAVDSNPQRAALLRVARDATIRWLVENQPAEVTGAWGLPVAGETYDGDLNDINGFHVTPGDVFGAIDGARGGAIEMGSVGGGTGMIAYDFKGGSGSASRLVGAAGERFTVGAFVQANFGSRPELVVAGVPVGRHITGGEVRRKPGGSIIAIIATEAPLMPHQCKRLARRVGMGIARNGSVSHNGSGDIFLAFSTANAGAWAAGARVRDCRFLPNDTLDGIFAGVTEATDEAIVDAMVANETMTGRDDTTVMAQPHERLREVLSQYGRLARTP